MLSFEELRSFSTSGEGLDVCAENYSMDEIRVIAQNAKNGGGLVRVTGARKLSNEELHIITLSGRGHVIFEW